nr:MAG TPA: hypothetical protein [Caudoviricetes sp.]
MVAVRLQIGNSEICRNLYAPISFSINIITYFIENVKSFFC